MTIAAAYKMPKLLCGLEGFPNGARGLDRNMVEVDFSISEFPRTTWKAEWLVEER